MPEHDFTKSYPAACPSAAATLGAAARTLASEKCGALCVVVRRETLVNRVPDGLVARVFYYEYARI